MGPAEREVLIPDGAARLAGSLALPPDAPGVVMFAHGSGSSRHSPRNRYVALQLHEAGFGTLLMDLLTTEEDADPLKRFDIALLTRRLAAATAWLRQEFPVDGLQVAYFGASTGAAAALQAAADIPDVRAVVSRGGRPDLAGRKHLSRVTVPTLLIVGGDDFGVVELNRQAYALLGGEKELAIVPRATHLFEEPGALEQVAALAREWFARYLFRPRPALGR